MASTEKLAIHDANISTTTNSTAIDSAPNVDKIIGWLKIANYLTLTSIDVVVEHSPNGTDWISFQVFAQATGNTFEAIEINKSLFPKVRMTATLVGAGSADVLVELYCDPDK